MSWLFGDVEKRLDKEAMVNNKIYDVTGWTKNNYSTYINPISLEVKAISNQARKFGQLIIYSVRNIFLKKKCRKWGRDTASRPLFVFEKSIMR